MNLIAKRRIGIVSRAVFEIREVVDDIRTNVLGGLSLSFFLWKSSVLQMLLSGAECWVGMSKKTVNNLEKLRLKQLRVGLAIGTGVPKAHLYAQTGTWTIANQVLLLKLRFLHHVALLGTCTRLRPSKSSQA